MPDEVLGLQHVLKFHVNKYTYLEIFETSVQSPHNESLATPSHVYMPHFTQRTFYTTPFLHHVCLS